MDCGEAVRPGRTTPVAAEATSSTSQSSAHHEEARGEPMTETVNTGPTVGKAAAKASAGMSISRVFSTEGVHPYDELTWERRDVVQTNWKTGDTVFEQRGVEFPSTWSVNASTIVTTKYFRGAVGTDVREWSLKQLIDRVVSTYVKG